MAVILVGLMIVSFAAPLAAADHDNWIVAKVRGGASHGPGDGTWAVALVGDRLLPGRHVQTGPDGRLTIIRGFDRIDIGPNARFVVGPPATRRDGMVQRLGRMLFDIADREPGSFAVDTPLLAVVIKGTRFTVDVSAAAAGVTVEEGLVEVTATGSGTTALVEPGFTATVTAASGELEVQASGSRTELDDGADTDTGVAGSIGGTADDVAGNVSDAVGATADAVGETASSAGDATGGARESVGGLADSVGGALGGL